MPEYEMVTNMRCRMSKHEIFQDMLNNNAMKMMDKNNANQNSRPKMQASQDTTCQLSK